MQKVVVKINLKHLRSNAAKFIDRVKVPVYAVVKADAYGHGAQEVAVALSGLVKGYAVSLIEEGLVLSTAACGKEILVFTPPTDEKEVWLMLKNRLVITISSLRTACLVDKVCKASNLPARIQLKCNTGMNRYGLSNAQLGKVCVLLKSNESVSVEGMYSHLYAHDVATANAQRTRFLSAQRIAKKYFPSIQSHLSSTYGSLLGEAFAFDAVRIGIGLYGYLPDDVTEGIFPLQRVMEVYAKCEETHRYRSGGVGYMSFAPTIGEKMSTYRYGYADGFAYDSEVKNLSFEPFVRPCMDACICRGWEKIGRWIPVMTDARERAKEEGSICYEILCRASSRAERIYGYW